MPLIMCPSCNRVTYAYPIYNDYGEILAYRCSECWNAYNTDQVHVIPFPNVEILLNATFSEFIAYVDKVDLDDVQETRDDLAERFIHCLLFLTRPNQPRLYRDRQGRVLLFYAAWSYVGTRKDEEYNEELHEEAQRLFAEAVDRGYTVVEIREPDEGDSIFIAVHPDDVKRIVDVLDTRVPARMHSIDTGL